MENSSLKLLHTEGRGDNTADKGYKESALTQGLKKCTVQCTCAARQGRNFRAFSAGGPVEEGDRTAKGKKTAFGDKNSRRQERRSPVEELRQAAQRRNS